jgi:hypothetical protein
MPPAAEFFRSLAQSRIDAVVLLAGTTAACFLLRRFLRRRGAEQFFSGRTCLVASAFALTVIALAEIGCFLIDRSGEEVRLYVRTVVLAGGGFSIGIVIGAATRLALLQARIRQQAETERRLQEAKQAADVANRAKSDFLAVMSHEIRTPLNAVMGFANLLSETRLDEAQRGYLATITSEGTRLSSLVSDILDLSKIEEGRLVLERLPFAPVETVHEVLRLLSARAMEKRLDLRFEAQIAGHLLVAGDPLRFRQVLVNLVDNAIKFTTAGTVTVTMRWDAPATPDGVSGALHVAVQDSGIGIPDEKIGNLFQMFMQADTSTTRRFGGTGLGLAICQRLVNLMGGNIEVESAPGQGSRFSFRLPLAPVALPAADAPGPENPPHPSVPHRPPRILVVDDMETNRFLLEVFLRRNGFDPELAAGGEEAVRLATTKVYDAILLDLHMPEVDGFATARRIREFEATQGRRTSIIALTASIAKGTREKCLAAGMDEYLTKPLDLRRFKQLLESRLQAAAVSR